MRKCIILTSFTLLLLMFCGNLNSVFAQTNPTQNIKIKSITLDKTKVVRWCPLDKPIEGELACTKEGSQVNISTEVASDDKNLEYYYIISSGKIIGKGKNVIWDFPNSEAGKHTLTIGVGKNNKILSETISKTVTLVECTCCLEPPCVCPNVAFDPFPKEVKPGDIIVLSVKSIPPEAELQNSQWKIQGGEIIKGQGTNTILVKVSEKSQTNTLTIAVKTQTDCELCQFALSESIPIIK